MSDAETRLALRMLAGSILNRYRIVFDSDGTDQEVSLASPMPVAIVSGGGGGTGGSGDASAANQALQLAAIGATNSAPAADETANTGLNGLVKGMLATLRARLPALVGGLLPVSVPTTATTTRSYNWAAGQHITTAGAGAVRSAAVVAGEVLLHASGRGFVAIGSSTIVASGGAGSIPLEAGEKFHLRLTSGQFISWIRDGATDASLTIMPVAG